MDKINIQRIAKETNYIEIIKTFFKNQIIILTHMLLY